MSVYLFQVNDSLICDLNHQNEYRVQNEIFVGVLSRQKRSDRWLSKIYNNIAKTKNLPKFQNIEILKFLMMEKKLHIQLIRKH